MRYLAPVEQGAIIGLVMVIALKLVGALTISWLWVFLTPVLLLTAAYILAFAWIGTMILINLASIVLFPEDD